jgi:hypothetical protein
MLNELFRLKEEHIGKRFRHKKGTEKPQKIKIDYSIVTYH